MDLSGVASLPEDFLEWKQSRRHLWLVFDREQVCEGIRHKVTVGQIVGHASNAPKGVRDPVSEFSPTEELASYVVRAWRQAGLDVAELQSELGTEVTIGPISFEQYSDDELIVHAQAQLSRTIRDVLAAVASVFQRSLTSQNQETRSASIQLTHHGRFRPFVAPLIVRHFPIEPTDLDGFLRVLFRELRSLAKSEQFGGSWGRLAVSPDSELVLRVNRPVEQVVTSRRRARKVKWSARK